MKHAAAVIATGWMVSVLALVLVASLQGETQDREAAKTDLQATLGAERGYYGDSRLELITFHLMNHARRTLNTEERSWQLVIDGKPAPDPGGQLWTGPRPAEGYGSLDPGRDLRFGEALPLHEYFPEHRQYKIFWRAAGFRSNTVVVNGGAEP
jgi:hypothetical protein